MIPRRTGRPSMFVVALLVAASSAAALLSAPAAASTPMLPPEAPDGALYAGVGPEGRTVVLIVERAPDGTMAARLLEEPPMAGERPGLDMFVAGPFAATEARLTLAGETRARTPGAAGGHLELGVPRGGDGALDPFGVARVVLRSVRGGDEPGTTLRLRLEGIGTLLTSETALADGSLRLARHAPFFYAEPWRGLDVASYARLEVDPSLGQGLAARRGSPEGPTSAWWDERTVTVQSLSRRLVSLRVEHHVYSGGAHPNTQLMALNLMSGPDGTWRPAAPCDVLGSLGRVCDLQALREAVVRDLIRQGAAWVVDGEVDAGTPWLLDRLTVTPSGLQVDFAPYAVGPYAQGVFTVHLSFEAGSWGP